MEQKHLSHAAAVNYGSFYTPKRLVDMVYSLVSKNINAPQEFIFLDTSCGYGGFLNGADVLGGISIGADIDADAVAIARQKTQSRRFFTHNSLFNVSRSQYDLNKNTKIIIVGNPPYNDTTSIIRNKIKKETFERDADVFSRDLGISFLLSYNKLQADYVCVLHPLSYLIKKANFESLGSFKKNYKLTDSYLISSGEFSATSKSTQFPIIIAFYERNLFGMDYNYILNYKFKTHDNKTFSINEYDSIGKYITKYPNQKTVSKKEAAAFFYTMRDINALKRTATFVNKESYNTIRVQKEKLEFYCYVDIFKEYIPYIPYYFGNSDCFIDKEAFQELSSLFLRESAKKHPALNAFIDNKKRYNDSKKVINKYFKELLGEHYVD